MGVHSEGVCLQPVHGLPAGPGLSEKHAPSPRRFRDRAQIPLSRRCENLCEQLPIPERALVEGSLFRRDRLCIGL